MLIDGDKMQAKKHGEKWIILKENLRSDAKTTLLNLNRKLANGEEKKPKLKI